MGLEQGGQCSCLHGGQGLAALRTHDVLGSAPEPCLRLIIEKQKENFREKGRSTCARRNLTGLL